MRTLNLAVAARCFEVPVREAILAAAAAGAGGVQFDARHELRPSDFSETGRRQFLQRLGEHGLKIASLSFPTRRTFYDADELDRRVAAIKASMEFAWQLQCRVVTARIGRIPADLESPQYQTLCEVLEDLAAYGNRIGATLSISPTHESPEQLATLLGRIETGPLGINFDPATFVMTGHDSGQAFRTLHDRITHIRVRDAVREIDGSGIEVAVGRGDVEWDELLALVGESGYSGWMTADRTSGDDQAGDVARAIQFLQRVAFGA